MFSFCCFNVIHEDCGALCAIFLCVFDIEYEWPFLYLGRSGNVSHGWLREEMCHLEIEKKKEGGRINTFTHKCSLA